MTDVKPATLAEALTDLQANLPTIVKSETATVPTRAGGSYVYHYADLSTITREVLPLLSARDLAWVCAPTLTDAGRFVLRYRLLHVSGESLDGEYPLPANGTAQELGSAITYARRYALTSVIGLAPAADDDGAAASARPAGRRSRASTQDDVSRETVSAKGDPAPSEAALKRMFASFNDAGIRDKDGQLNLIEEVTGRRVESRKEMTAAEVSAVTRTLVEGAGEAKEHGR